MKDFEELDFDDFGEDLSEEENDEGFETEEDEEELELKIEEETESTEDDELSLEELMGPIEKADKKGKSKSKKDKKKTATKTKEKEKYKGKRTIIVYGDKLWIEEDPEVTEEQIRERIVTEFGYSEFKKNVLFDLDEESGILCVGKAFQKKG